MSVSVLLIFTYNMLLVHQHVCPRKPTQGSPLTESPPKESQHHQSLSFPVDVLSISEYPLSHPYTHTTRFSPASLPSAQRIPPCFPVSGPIRWQSWSYRKSSLVTGPVKIATPPGPFPSTAHTPLRTGCPSAYHKTPSRAVSHLPLADHHYIQSHTRLA